MFNVDVRLHQLDKYNIGADDSIECKNRYQLDTKGVDAFVKFYLA